VCAAALAFVGCTEDIELLRDKVDQLKQRPGVKPADIPVMKTPDPYFYLSEGKRDPFRSKAVEADEEGSDQVQECLVKPDPNRVKEDLESFPLDSLDMVGTLGRGSDFYGLVKDPNGVVHRVTAGNFLGANTGRIILVRDDGIDLTELVPDGNGCFEVKEASISLEDSRQ
jgi:type IV pilus assembly protein PilP